MRPGDELDFEATVLEKRELKSRPGTGVFAAKVHLRNQKRETVLQCIGSVLVARRPDAKVSTST